MALTTYSGLSIPYFQRAGSYLTTNFGDPPFYYNAGSSITTSSSYIVSMGLTFQRLLPGDRLLFIGYQVSTAIITQITSGSITFSKIGSITQGTTIRQEAWVSDPVTVPTAIADIAVALSAATNASGNVYLVKNASSFTCDLATGNDAFPAITGRAKTQANTLLISAAVTTSVPDAGQLPPYIFVSPASAQLNPTISAVLVGGVPKGAWTAVYGPADGIGMQPTAQFNTIGAGNWVALQIQVNGPTVTLDDLNYQLRDDPDAVLLNNFTGAPIFDLDSITGLNDSTTISSNEAIDGTDGSYVNAKFLTGKTVVFDGTMYANPPLDETYIDQLKNNWRPATSDDPDGVPLFYKTTNKPLRVLFVKPLAAVSAIDRSHTLGQVPFQLQAASPDARSYSLPQLGSLFTPGGVSAVTFTPGGNIETGIKFFFAKYSIDASTIANDGFVFQQYTDKAGLVGEVTIACNPTLAIPNGIYCLDVGARTLTFFDPFAGQPIDYTAYLIETNWFMLQPNVSNQVIFARPQGGTLYGLIGATYEYADAWR